MRTIMGILHILGRVPNISSAFTLSADRSDFHDSYRRNRFPFPLRQAVFPPSACRTILTILIAVLGSVIVSFSFSGGATPAYGAEKPRMPSIGSGPYELYVFTDYFCGPCQALERELDITLRELMVRNSVKIMFIDLPLSRQTVLYNRYFLYAARAADSGRDILLARQELFALAGRDAAADEKKIVRLFKSRNITFKVYDLKPVHAELNRIIKQFNIRSTPTCVVKYSSTDIRTYRGVFEIRNGLAVLRAATARLQ